MEYMEYITYNKVTKLKSNDQVKFFDSYAPIYFMVV